MKILCIGDLSLDIYSPMNKKFFAGCSVNLARHLYSTLSFRDVGPYVPIGTDQASKDAQKFLESTNMEVRLKIIEGQLPRQPIESDPDSKRHVYDYADGILPSFIPEDLESFFFKKWDMLVFPYFKQVEAMTEKLLSASHGMMSMCDFGNLSDYNGKLTSVRSMLKKLRYAQFSCDQSEISSNKRISFLMQRSIESDILIVDTRGAQGAIAFKDGLIYECHANKVARVIDSTGAGDAFFAHMLYHYFVNKKSLPVALELSCVGASQQLKHLGPGPEEFLN